MVVIQPRQLDNHHIHQIKDEHYHFMFTREELNLESLENLRELCITHYGLRPLGNPATKEAYINALLTFPAVACTQTIKNTGLRMPHIAHVQNLRALVEGMNRPSPEQSALVKATMEGFKLPYPARYTQERLHALTKVKWYLDEAIKLLELM